MPFNVAVYPGLQRHLASLLMSMHWEFGPQTVVSHGSEMLTNTIRIEVSIPLQVVPLLRCPLYLRLQSFPTLGSGQRHLCWGSQIAFPGQSEFFLQVTTPTHLVRGSGAGMVPSGHWQAKVPGWLTQTAPIPQASLLLHSLMSKRDTPINWHSSFSYSIQVPNLSSNIPKHCLNGFPEKPGAHWQWNPPGVLVQRALAPHLPDGPCTLSHSFTSVQESIISLTAVLSQCNNQTENLLTNTTSCNIIWIESPTFLADAVSFWSVRLAERVRSTCNSFTRRWKRIDMNYTIIYTYFGTHYVGMTPYLCMAFLEELQHIRSRIRSGIRQVNSYTWRTVHKVTFGTHQCPRRMHLGRENLSGRSTDLQHIRHCWCSRSWTCRGLWHRPVRMRSVDWA